MNQTYKIVKLTNGEDIICQLKKSMVSEDYRVINFPLKLRTELKYTSKGLVESLGLDRWVGPFTEQTSFPIKNSHILLVADASEGLSKYYEYVIKEFAKTSSIEEQLDQIEDEEVYDELLDDIDIDLDTIH